MNESGAALSLAGVVKTFHQAGEDLEIDKIAAVQALTETRTTFRRDLAKLRGGRILGSFVSFEGRCLKKAVKALVSGNIEQAVVTGEGEIVFDRICAHGLL